MRTATTAFSPKDGSRSSAGEARTSSIVRKARRDTRLLLKNYRLSDDIAFRFSSHDWAEWPLTAEKFAAWVNPINGNGETVNLFMDYETFGEHQWEDTGIFHFLERLVPEILRNPDNDFKTPSEVIAAYPVRDEIDVPAHPHVGRHRPRPLRMDRQRDAAHGA